MGDRRAELGGSGSARGGDGRIAAGTGDTRGAARAAGRTRGARGGRERKPSYQCNPEPWHCGG
uniref:Uncharacterized protein n=1 Tax=Arundo donax TaxID=35708 RepID=A0A0A8YQA3_ARUDO